jgi:hypothetical protein
MIIDSFVKTAVIDKKMRDMKIDLVAFDSFGIKSMCTRVKTSDITITIDPGVAAETGSFPLPDDEKIRLIMEYEEAIRKSCESSEVIVITHYHYDHHMPIADEGMYGDKILLVKDPLHYINKSQRRRASEFLGLVEGMAKEIRIADGVSMLFGGTKLKFSRPLWHGVEGSKLGYVIMLGIEENEKILFSSDVSGPIVEEYATMIINEMPDVLILDGPPTYILGYIMSYKNLARAILNIERIIRKIDGKIILDHHLMRDYRYKDLLKVVYDRASELGKDVLSAAEVKGEEPMVLKGFQKYGKTKWEHWEPITREKLEAMLR